MRFLRKKYTDPLTGKDDWKPVLFGQAHVRPLGFFGQPLMTAGAVAGAGSMYAVTTTTTTDANGVPIARRRHIGDRRFGGQFRGDGNGIGIDESEPRFAERDLVDVPADVDDSGHGFADGFAHRNERDRDVGDDVRRRRTDCGVYATGGQGVAGRLQAANALQQVGIQLRPDRRSGAGAGWVVGRDADRDESDGHHARHDGAGDADDESKSGDSFSTHRPHRSAAMKKARAIAGLADFR
jgi:hypothetical protein